MRSKGHKLMPDGVIPELQVADVDAALGYYRDILGFPPIVAEPGRQLRAIERPRQPRPR